MTSHDLAPDGLPYVEAGMIWDGVIEYHNGLSPGASIIYLLRMYGDGTRRFSEFFGSDRPAVDLRYVTGQGWEQIGFTFDYPYNIIDYRDGGFLAYDGTMSFNPANQHFLLNEFKSHAARFAHQLDAGMGGHTLASADERDRLAVHRSLSAMIASAARRYAEWDAIDPEELIVGGEFDGTPLWKHHERVEQDYIDIDLALCGQCDIEEYAREFFFEADLAAFRQNWRNGFIYAADRSATPWAPILFDVATPDLTIGQFHDELDGHYHRMLRYYAQVVAVQDRAHAI